MKRKRKWRGYLAAVLLIGVVLAGCRRTGGDVNSGDTDSMAGDTMTSTETEAAASEETGSETESRKEQVMANESETELQRVSEKGQLIRLYSYWTRGMIQSIVPEIIRIWE